MMDLALLDLLECPLCFERLDVNAKILPCQHTFCEPCLHRLAVTRPVLRCPECRAPVGQRVGELPANLLLIRLLEGLKQGHGKFSANTLRERYIGKNREGQYSQPRQKNTLDGVPWARALYNYRGSIPGELSFKSGDIVILRHKVDENWYHGEANGSSGLIAASHVQVVKHLPHQLPMCRALYDFELKDKDPENRRDCLTFLKGDIITVIRRVDDNWVEGKRGDKVGIFPLKFTEPNAAALKLLSKQRSGSGSSPDAPSRRCSSGMPHSSASGASSRPLHPVQPCAPERQHPSIKQPTYVGPSNPSVAGSLHSLQTSTVEHMEGKMSCEPQPSISMALLSPQAHFASSEDKQSSTQQLSISVCAALYSYTPRRPEELELHKGEMVGVYGKFKEGWLRGLSLRTGKIGVLPGNYVIPVLRTAAKFLDPKPTPTIPSVSSAKRPSPSKTEAAEVALDKGAPNGTNRPAAQASLVSMTMAPVSSTRVAQLEGSQSRSTLRRATLPLQKGSPVDTQNLSCPPVPPRTRSNIAVGGGRPQGWLSEAALPSAGSCSTQEASSGPQSILVKPDSQRNGTEKPVKSVRFLTEAHTPSGSQTCSSGEQDSFLPSQGVSTHRRKGTTPTPAATESLKTPSSLSRYRVLTAYTAQSDPELRLKEGEQRLRQDGRVVVPQEKSGRKGPFHSSVLDALEKLG